MENTMNNWLSHLECSRSGKKYDARELHNISEQGAPLLARYDLDRARKALNRHIFSSREDNLWRYRELLPVRDSQHLISLGEGCTPLRRVDRLSRRMDFSRLYIKDESLNPTGSFKARGIAVAISAAVERGASKFAMPSAGNAAGAMAAYTAEAGVESNVFMPKDTPLAFRLECDYYGANVELIEGLITDCGKLVEEHRESEGWFEVSTLKEPYRIEGKKTMGYELAEQLDWSLPDVIIYPTGGGTGLIGMWKAFEEMEQLGWIGPERPRMVVVQTEGCAPIVRAFSEGRSSARAWDDAETVVSGLKVPDALGDFLILDALYESNGTAVAVSDEDCINYSRMMASHTGIFPAPEGGATLAAFDKLHRQKWIREDDRVVLFNTGSGLKYLEALNRQVARPELEQA